MVNETKNNSNKNKPEADALLDYIPIVNILKQAKDFFDLLQELKEEVAVPELSFKQLLKEVMDKQPDDDSVEYASAIRRKTAEGKLKIFVVYLDEHKKPVMASKQGENYSFAINTKGIDAELNDMFGNKDIIIFE